MQAYFMQMYILNKNTLINDFFLCFNLIVILLILRYSLDLLGFTSMYVFYPCRLAFGIEILFFL